MRAHPTRRSLRLPVLFGLMALACAPPAGPEPSSQGQLEQAQQQAQGLPAGTPRADSARDLQVLEFPSVLPTTVYTRTAPTSLVDERGTPLQVLTGHHTRLELMHVFKDRAQVACTLCPTPAEGWLQLNMIMPSVHSPSPEELADDRLALALYVADLRQALEQSGSFPDRQPSPDERALLLRIMDQGFAVEDREAMAPASGGAYAREGASIRLRRGPETWRVKAVELPAEPGGAAEGAAASPVQ